MIKLAHIFADNALYLSNSTLTVRGSSAPLSTVTLTLCRENDEREIVSSCATSDEIGKFAVSFATPSPSFDKYKITVSSEGESFSIGGILFGELWLASGQSNMELPNSWCNEWEEMKQSIADLPIRVYQIGNLPSDYEYSRAPLEDYPGFWAEGDRKELWASVSACATSFARELYSYFLERGRQVPVGFVNASRGGSNIECWIPEADALENKAVAMHLKTVDLYPTDENYNTRGSGNYNQVGCYYNFKINPTLGVRYRGVLWYQGESNIGSHSTDGSYSDLLEQLYFSLRSRFAESENEVFPIISSHIYPWKFYSCTVGYLNTSITYLSEKHPTRFIFVPLCDMKSAWSFQTNNHPIHPTHKYELGERFALLAENALYGRGGQKTPATLEGYEVLENRILLRFKNVGDGIYIKGGEARCLYIRSEKSVYTKAYARVVDKCTLEVSHPYIENPTHVCYAMSSFEHYANLFAGELPIGPFSTEADIKTGFPKIDVKVKNWLNLELDGELFVTENDANSFPRAIYHPSDGSEIGYDGDYALTARCLRIRGSEDGFGCYVLSHRLRELDLENYKELRLSVLNSKDLAFSIRLYYSAAPVVTEGQSIEQIIHDQGSISESAEKKAVSRSGSVASAVSISERVVEIAGRKLTEYRSGWADFSVDFEGIPSGEIEKMELWFKIGEGNHLRTTAAIDKLILNPRQ